MQKSYRYLVVLTGLSSFLFLSGFGIFGHKKYEAPITKDTLQPDKILFDRAIKDIEHGNYETARLTLNTLINTYDSSEYLAKAKLAIADAWYREGGAHGFAQAEAEYKDFILFYPNMEEAAESQYKICQIHYRQMEKSDRDNAQAQRAEDECRQVMVQFPNSKFTPQATQLLRNTQEVLADKEYKTGDFYYGKGSFPAAASRLSFLSQQYPMYSGSDDALWQLADSYKHMGDHFENQEGDALTRIVRDYPLSLHAAAAKQRLQAMNRPVPTADLNAYNRMKADLDGRTKAGIVHRAIGPFESTPEVNLASKTGTPSMAAIRPSLPVSIPASAAGTQGAGVSDVTVGQVGDTTAIDQKPDARLGAGTAETQTTAQATTPAAPGAAGNAGGTGEQKATVGSTGLANTATATTTPPAAVESLPTNHPITKDQIKAQKAAQARVARIQKKEQEQKAKLDAKAGKKPATTPAAAGTTPGAATDIVQPASKQ